MYYARFGQHILQMVPVGELEFAVKVNALES